MQQEVEMENDYSYELDCVWIANAKNKERSSCIENLHKLFHYTSKRNKEKIVSENEVVFRLSRVNDFLDKNEGIQILEPFYYACGELYDKKQIEKTFYELLKTICQKDLNAFISKWWVLCFSQNGNSSFLKKRYAPDDGYVLALNISFWDDLLINFPHEIGTIDLINVEYSFHKMHRMLQKNITECYKKYLTYVENTPNCEIKNINEKTKKMLIKWLCEYSLGYKSSDYKNEEEVRLLCKFENFSIWKNDENTVKFQASTAETLSNIEIHLNKKCLLEESQHLSIHNDTKLNKMHLTSQELHNVYTK